MFQRHFASLLLGIYSFFCLTCLTWSADSFARTAKHAFYYLLSPASLPVLSQMDQWGTFGHNMAQLLRLDQSYRDVEDKWRRRLFDERRFRALEEENQRLAALLGLPPLPDYKPFAARILARDTNDWFHSLLVLNGQDKDVSVSDPVVTIQGDREVLVGQVVEVFGATSRVLLVTDPLSAVSARVSRTGEEGIVEGQGANRLFMNYLFSDSDVQVGDEVVTAGLGQVFPEGVLLGHIEEVEGASRENFKRARLAPAVLVNRLNEVLVLHRMPQEKGGQ
ncbi:MAG: rod shape-determining protein MreC [Elusimicrobia bacterium]|nr:rod shape-determining protein MreC [Elusimicrobiota bacterium]